MEQQTISIAKAGISCSLPSRTAVLAAANPVGGHFDRTRSVSENLNMSAPMLSRFDLLFVLLDRADAAHDLRLTEHVMNLHSAADSVHATPAAQATNDSAGSSLVERLRPPQEFHALPPPLLRKYICYVRRYVRPQLSHDAACVLKACFMRLREQSARAGEDALPVTTRTLEALVRLAEARAKLEGRDQVGSGRFFCYSFCW